MYRYIFVYIHIYIYIYTYIYSYGGQRTHIERESVDSRARLQQHKHHVRLTVLGGKPKRSDPPLHPCCRGGSGVSHAAVGRAHMNTWIHMDACLDVYVNQSEYIFVCVCTCVCAYTHTFREFSCPRVVYTYIHTYTHTNI